MSAELYKLIFLILFFIFFFLCFSTSLFVKNIKKGFLIKISLLCLGFFVIFYIRSIVYGDSIFASFDESNYKNILYRFVDGKESVISGPGYVYLLSFINYITKINFSKLIPAIPFITAPLSMLMIYFLFRSELKNKNTSFLACILLLINSFFIWTINENRPEQLGILLFTISAFLFYKYISRSKHLALFLLFYSITFIYHFLSFLMLFGACFFVIYWKYLKKEAGSLKKMIILLVPSICFLFLFTTPWFLYSGMYRGMMFASLLNYPLCLINVNYILSIFFTIAIIIFIIITPILRAFISKVGVKKITKILTRPFFIAITILSIIFVVFLQYKLISNVLFSLYLNSLPYFFFFSLGNISFGILFLVGFFKLLKSHEKYLEYSIFLQYSFSLMLIGPIAIISSILLPSSFNGMLTRVLDYWAIFASPIALIPILSVSSIKNSYKFLLGGFVAFLMLLSLISASKDPRLFNYGLYWTKTDVSTMRWLCDQEGIFYIKNSKDFEGTLSKNQNYYMLMEMLIYKEHIQCKINLASKSAIKNYEKNIVYNNEDIVVYKIIPSGDQSIPEKSFFTVPEGYVPSESGRMNKDIRCLH